MSYLCCTQSLPAHLAAAVRQTPPTPRAPVTTTTPCALRQQTAFARALKATLGQQETDAVSCYVYKCVAPNCFLYSLKHSWELIATKPARVYACCCKIFSLNGITFLFLPLSFSLSEPHRSFSHPLSLPLFLYHFSHHLTTQHVAVVLPRMPLAFFVFVFLVLIPQWGAADAEIKVPVVENTELKRSPFRAWSRSAYSHTNNAYCQGFLPRWFLLFLSIYLHFFQNLSRVFPVLAVANTESCVGQQNKIGHPAGCRFPCWVPTEYK